jgi:hypothetical protein
MSGLGKLFPCLFRPQGSAAATLSWSDWIDVTWSNLTNMTAIGSALDKTAGGNNWSATAWPVTAVLGNNDWELEYVMAATVFEGGAIGVDASPAAGNPNALADYSFNANDQAFWGANVSQIWENGVQKLANQNINAGDIMKIARVGNEIKYYKNGALLYTSATAPSGNYYPFAGAYHQFAGTFIASARYRNYI